ncbi:uncharacterized protein LOC119546981 isoform X2 [Drosophila subpulchrella]|nr:uncharacterized protein LOC119546981 isoform X2 [Drosophila subpulchrella]XP_037709560.1 uncharacterized protein LOC119546981 isoform X2 [Drosophila subpulchrella]
MRGGRLVDIAPYCNHVIRFEFKMKFDCDASEYAPLAKMQGLRQLTIHGEHEPGTLQRLFVALARKEPKLSDLSIENALLNYEDTAPLSQIKLLKNLRCGFMDPQSIEPISKMIYLNSLKVLSQHTFISISQQIYSILKESQSEIKIFLKDCKMKYNPKGKLRLVLNQVSASDYGLLVTLPHLKCLEINGYYEQGTLVEIFKMLQLVQVERLKIWPMDFRSELQEEVVQCLPLTEPALEVQEIEALSNCGSLKILFCEFADTKNIHLLHNLFALEELNISTKPLAGSLQALFAALASREVPSLQYFRLLDGAIDSMEAAELARIKSLKLVDCAFVDARDIEKFADLAKEHLETLEITSKQNFHETSPGILRVLQCSENNMWVSTKDIVLMSNRKLRFVVLQMSYSEMYTDETLLVPLKSVEWLEELILAYKQDNIITFFDDISMRTNNRRQVP